MTATALVITDAKTMELQTYEVPPLKADDVLIRTEYSGVSQGTEIDAYRGARPELTFPTVTGYQSVGVVQAIGAEVSGLAVGDRVLFTTSRLPNSYPFTWMAGHVSHAVASMSSRAPIKLPAEVDPVEAALTAMVAVGLGGIVGILQPVQLDPINVVIGDGLNAKVEDAVDVAVERFARKAIRRYSRSHQTADFGIALIDCNAVAK